MTSVDFLVIGAMKAGTSSLHAYLSAHPQLFLPVHKEPHHFAYPDGAPAWAGPGEARLRDDVVTDAERYAALFAPAGAEQRRGEASTSYLYEPGTAARIHRRAPQVRLVAVLRDPVTRAYSAYNHLRRDGREEAGTFAEGLRREPARLARGYNPLWAYERGGLYGQQLREYVERFDASQLCVVTYEELRADPLGTYRRLCVHLDVDPTFTPDVGTRHNVSGVPRSPLLHRVLSATGPVSRRVKQHAPASLVRSVIGVRNAALRPVAPMPEEVRRRARRALHRGPRAARGASRPPLPGVDPHLVDLSGPRCSRGDDAHPRTCHSVQSKESGGRRARRGRPRLRPRRRRRQPDRAARGRGASRSTGGTSRLITAVGGRFEPPTARTCASAASASPTCCRIPIGAAGPRYAGCTTVGQRPHCCARRSPELDPERDRRPPARLDEGALLERGGARRSTCRLPARHARCTTTSPPARTAPSTTFGT